MDKDLLGSVGAPRCAKAFERRLGRKCHQWSFEDVADGVLEQDRVRGPGHRPSILPHCSGKKACSYHCPFG